MLHIVRLIERRAPRHGRRTAALLLAASLALLGAGLAALLAH